MSDWTSGYVADIGYTFGYYSELNPQRIKLSFLNAGLVFPEITTACELGYGQGLSLNIHSAASSVKWYGTDFNPSQAGFARELADISGSGANLYDQSFEEFCNRNDLPDFDFISLHGIWSWISDENKRTIVDFIKRKLKIGGVLYISYNTLPGWAAMLPMRHLLTLHADVMGASGHGILGRIDSALEFASKMVDTNPAFTKANPSVPERLKKIKEQNRNYLAHEYFNRDWHPMHFADMASWLAPAKLDYACSSNYADYVDVLNLTAEQQSLINEIKDPLFRESVRDFMVNQQFRRDYWVKGARKLSVFEQAELLRSQRVMLVVPADTVNLKMNGALGEVTLHESVYRPIIDALSDNKPKTVSYLEQALKPNNISLAQVFQAILLLIGKGSVSAVQDEKTTSKISKQTKILNSHLFQKARGSSEIGFLSSPVTGGGVAVNRIQQLFLLSRYQEKRSFDDMVAFAWQTLSAQGQKLLKEGKMLETESENKEELKQIAKNFIEREFPVLKHLSVE